MEAVDQKPARELALTAAAESTEPPPLQIVPWLRLRSFEREDAGRVIRLTLTGELRSGSRPPRRVSLIVRRGEVATAFHSTGTRLERAGSARPGSRACLCWTVTFALPPALVEDPRTSFKLLGHRRGVLELPAPAMPAIEPPTAAGARRAVGALASAAVVSAAALLASPAATIADTGAVTGSSTPASTPATGAGTSAPAGTGTTSNTTASTTPPASTTTTTPTTTTPTTTTPTTTTPTTTTPTTTTPTTATTTPTTTAPTTTTATPTTATMTATPTTTTSTIPKAPAVHYKPSKPKPAGSKPKPKPIGSTVLNLPTHQGASKHSKTPESSKTSKTSKLLRARTAKRSKGDACPPAVLELERMANRPGKGDSSSCTPASHKSVNSNTAGGEPSAYVPNVGPIAPVTVPSSSSQFGGSVNSNPFTPVQVQRYAQLVGALSQPPAYLVRIYKAAARMYKIPWQVLAAINYVETGYGADPYVSSAGAVGWMQFMPGTWARYGEVVDLRGKVVAHTASLGAAWNARDAIFSAARYLVAHGALNDLPQAIYAYNHAYWYVQEVLQVAEQINSQGMQPGTRAGRRISSMRTTAELLNGLPYVWGGGHSSWAVQVGYDCSGFVSAVLHAGGYLSQPVTTQSLPVQNGIVSGPGRWITVFDRTDGGSMESDHVIIDINGQWWESGGTSTLGVHQIHNMTAGYLQTFNVVLHPRGL